MKVALLTNMVPPYRRPLFEAVGESVDLTVIVSSLMEGNRQWQPFDPSAARAFETVLLRGVSINTRRGPSYVQPELPGVLRRGRFDVVISTGFGPNTLMAAAFKRAAGYRALLYCEATGNSERHISPLRRLYRRMVVRMHDGFIPSGLEARAYLVGLGAAEGDCDIAVDAVPPLAEEHRAGVAGHARLLRGRFAGMVLLYVGRVSRAKGVHHLFEAYKRAAGGREMSLVLMGGGELEGELRRRAAAKAVPNVHFIGFQDEVSKWAYYQAADAFVFPTTGDVWGLVVNEAMLSGLPVICSRYAGSASDLVADGVNGYVVDPADIGALAARIAALADSPARRAGMGRMSVERISHYTIAASARGFLTAIRRHGGRCGERSAA